MTNQEEEFHRYEAMAVQMCSGNKCNVASTAITLYARLGLMSLAGFKTNIKPEECLENLKKFEVTARSIGEAIGHPIQ